MKKNILVTGGAGYVGSALVEKLVMHYNSSDVEIIVVDKGLFGLKFLYDLRMEYKKTLKIYRQSLKQFCEMYPDFNSIKTVIHLSGLSNDPMADFDPKANMELNYEDTARIAHKALDHHIPRFVFASSASVYGMNENAIVNEDTKVNPISAYAESKVLAEQYLLDLKGLNPIILRKGTIMGPSPRMRFDLVVNAFVLSAMKTNKMNLIGGGETWRPLVALQDVVELYMKMTTMEDHTYLANSNSIYNVVQDNYRISELALRIRDFLVKPINIIPYYNKPRDVRSYRMSGDKLASAFGIRCRTDIIEASRAVYYWIIHNENSKDFNHPIFYNIKWLEMCKETFENSGYKFELI